MLLFATFGTAAPVEQLTRTHQQGRMITKENQVEYIAAKRPPVAAPTNQWLDFDDALRTLALSRATVRLTDWTQLYLKDHSRLEIVRQPVATNAPSLELQEGEMYLSSRGGAQSVPVKTPHAHGTPKGTEFLVRVGAGVTEFTMFDGEVELSNGADTQIVRSGQQGIAVPGQPIQVLNRIEARNLVQWWIYYPGILDTAELRFTAAERTQLAASLAAYQSGDLLQALAKYPGYPIPTEPATDAQRFYLAGLLLAVGSVDRAEAQLSRVGNSNAPIAVAFRTMIAAVTGNLSNVPPDSLSMTNRTATGFLAQSYALQSTNNLEQALLAARAATTNSPDFGFAWAQVAELEFGFGRIRAARDACNRALELAPRNAQAHAVRGFLLAAEYKVHEAIHEFDIAINLDPFLGNAWLGRGLCKRQLGILGEREVRLNARPHPGPLPQEREIDSTAPVQSDASGPLQARRTVLPLPGGEGRGEGEPKPSRSADRSTPLSAFNSQPDWLSDLQTAAIVEPRRSLIRSYAGKAFTDAGDSRLAHKELRYAAELDSKDPTPWLYSALLLQQENRINEAVEDLEHSIRLNDNRAVYRSRFLLDQDAAVRRANLAKVYQDAGLDNVALQEAIKSVSHDYANYSAHQFLAESYNALRDPTRFNLRYETVWFNELLLANVLAPVGAGLLSHNVSQQEYTRLFEANRLGFLSSTEIRSDGQFREIASQYGLLDRFAYTLDLDYQHNDGTRPNNDLDRIEWYSQFKYQLNDRDSVFLLAKYQDYEAGDNFQHYDPAASVSRQFRFEETQAPIVLGALHREWFPGLHSTLLAGRLHSDVIARGSAAVLDLRTNNPPPGIDQVRLATFDSSHLTSEFTAYIGELNQIWQGERHVSIAGARFQSGVFQTATVVDSTNALLQDYYPLPVSSSIDEPFQSWSIYLYHTQEIWDHFRLTAGLAYNSLRYPENFRSAPLSGVQQTSSRVLPKAALTWDPIPNVTVRGMYAQSVGGLSYDESVRLEPTQLAGFSQVFRSVISEAEVGSVVAPLYEIGAAALDVKLGRATFLELGAQWLRSDVDQTIGVFESTGDAPPPPQAVPATTTEKLDYIEKSFAVSLNQLLGDEWSVGAGYQFIHSTLEWDYPGIPTSTPQSPSRTEQALLHCFKLRLQFQHPSGFYAGAGAGWFIQDNDGYDYRPYTAPRGNESTYQVDLFLGYRFWRRRVDLTVGCLNVTDQDYLLNSLTPYPDLPRERVWVGRVRFNF